jgi:hypothetical protein
MNNRIQLDPTQCLPFLSVDEVRFEDGCLLGCSAVYLAIALMMEAARTQKRW